MNTIIQCGFTKPLHRVSCSDKIDLIQTLALQSVILSSLGELLQFRDGIDTLGVGEALTKHQELLRKFYYTDSKKIIGAGTYNLKS